MNRFKENTIIIGKGVELIEDEILRLEIEIIDLERIIETDKLEYDDRRNLVVVYEQRLEFMDQQTQQGSNNRVHAPIYSSTSAPAPIYSLLKEVLWDNLVEPHIMNMVMKEKA